jgi:KaiC/GvpD/RAD55 family RecA-like ATPase
MELREDEVEALLKLEGKELIVGYADGRHIAIIRGWYDDVQDTRSISRLSTESRIHAVHEVWEAYQEFVTRSVIDKCTQHAYLENAYGNIEIYIVKATAQPKRKRK